MSKEHLRGGPLALSHAGSSEGLSASTPICMTWPGASRAKSRHRAPGRSHEYRSSGPSWTHSVTHSVKFGAAKLVPTRKFRAPGPHVRDKLPVLASATRRGRPEVHLLPDRESSITQSGSRFQYT